MAEVENVGLDSVLTAEITNAVEKELVEASHDAVPEKFRGKSVEEVVKSYTDLEREFGRKNQELGDLRKLTDQALEFNKTPLPQENPTEEVDYDLEPEKAVERKIKEQLKPLEDSTRALHRDNVLSRIKEAHPDYKELLKDDKFVDYVKASPVRQRLYNEANKGLDFDSADEIFSNFKELNPTEVVEDPEKKEKRNQALADATLETGGAGGSSVKTYKRADLIQLKLNSPTEYERLYDEILKAYAEGRVR